MKRNILILTGLVFFILVLVWYFYKPQACREYACLSFKDKTKWRVAEIYENTEQTYRAILVNGSDKIRLEVRNFSSKKDAQLLTDIKIMQLKNLYENAKSPYPGMISDEIECQKQFKPVIYAHNSNPLSYTYIRTHLNAALQSGSCLESDLHFLARGALFFCENQKKWYQFELIQPWSTTATDDGQVPIIIRSLRCEK